MKALTCLYLVLMSVPAWADPALGRLFHTPEQRAVLDTARRNTPLNAIADQDQDRPSLSVSGLVTRSDGQRSSWVNGKLEHGAAPPHTRQGPAQLRVKLPEGEVSLKVGQSVDPATGTVTEAYRRLPVIPPAPAKLDPSAAKSAAPVTSAPSRDEDAETQSR